MKEESLVFAFDGYEESIRFTICGHIKKENGRNTDISYEAQIEDEDEGVQAVIWMDKDGNCTLDEYDNGLTEDELKKSPKIAEVISQFHTGKSGDTLAGRAVAALDECIARMGESLKVSLCRLHANAAPFSECASSRSRILTQRTTRTVIAKSRLSRAWRMPLSMSRVEWRHSPPIDGNIKWQRWLLTNSK